MKKFYRSFIKGTNWALAGLMGLLGFACSDDSHMAEYGTPLATYKISGYVTNEKGEAVPDIKIEAVTSDRVADSPVLSSGSGHYSVVAASIGRSEQVDLFVSDIDKEANGLYQNDTIRVVINSEDYYFEGDGWNRGEAAKQVNIVLKEKEKTDE